MAGGFFLYYKAFQPFLKLRHHPYNSMNNVPFPFLDSASAILITSSTSSGWPEKLVHLYVPLIKTFRRLYIFPYKIAGFAQSVL